MNLANVSKIHYPSSCEVEGRIVTRLRFGQRRNQGTITGTAKRVFLFSRLPD